MLNSEWPVDKQDQDQYKFLDLLTLPIRTSTILLERFLVTSQEKYLESVSVVNLRLPEVISKFPNTLSFRLLVRIDE